MPLPPDVIDSKGWALPFDSYQSMNKSMNAAKIAVSIPQRTFASLEKARKQLGVSRSALVSQAIDEWLASRQISQEDKNYAEAYLRHPEVAAEVAVLAEAVMSTWEPWE